MIKGMGLLNMFFAIGLIALIAVNSEYFAVGGDTGMITSSQTECANTLNGYAKARHEPPIPQAVIDSKCYGFLTPQDTDAVSTCVGNFMQSTYSPLPTVMQAIALCPDGFHNTFPYDKCVTFLSDTLSNNGSPSSLLNAGIACKADPTDCAAATTGGRFDSSSPQGLQCLAQANAVNSHSAQNILNLYYTSLGTGGSVTNTGTGDSHNAQSPHQ